MTSYKTKTTNRRRSVYSVYDLPSTNIYGRMAEWSKALVLGTSHFGGAGSNPVPVIIRMVIIKETNSLKLSQP